jgi:large subunit ribosomal protein L3
MAISLVGQKIGMTRLLSDDGSASSVSVIKIEPNRIVQTKSIETDGYNAVQVTTGKKTNKKGEAKIGRVSSSLKGHYAKASQEIGLGLWEMRTDDLNSSEIPKLDISLFGAGHFVNVTGQSKGKGFQGGVKRHNFSMQDATHGNSISHRAIGSTGQCQDPGRVFKGKKMAGQMGNSQVTEECLEILRVDSERNLLLVKGAIPGSKNGFVRVFLSDKKNTVNTKITKQLSENQVVEAEAVETPVSEAEAVETPVSEAEAVETQVAEAEAVETPEAEAEAVETPAAEVENTEDDETKA